MIKKILIISMCILGIISFAFAQSSMYQEPGQNFSNGKTKVSVAGTAVALASSVTRILSVSITWLATNQGKVYVGTSGVTANNGFEVTTGAILKLEVNDLSNVYVNADVPNDGVSWVAVLR